MSIDQLSRRELMRLGASTVGVLAGARLLTACGDPNDGRIKFFNWQDYIDKALLADFEDVSGLVVSYSTYASNDELADRVSLAGVARRGNRKGSGFDLIVPSDSIFRRFRDQDRLQALDSDIVTEALLGNLDPAFRSLAADPGNRFAIPWASGSTGIGYDTTVFPEPPDWSVFADPEYAGRTTLLDERREAFAAAHFLLGTDPNSINAAEIKAAESQLVGIAANAGFDSATYLDRLVDGKLVAVQGFSSDILQGQQRNPNLAFVIPAAGGTRWVDLLCIPENAPNAKGANRFIAFYLEGKVAAQNGVAVQADVGNTAAREFLPADLLDNPVISPTPDVAARLVELRDLGDDETPYTEAWERIRQ
jgi:spermidine/putrescine-binding protein